MADFKQAVLKTLVHEGGFQNNPKDWANWVGGKPMRDKYLATKDPALLVNLKGTKYGITAQDMPGVEIKDLTQDQAIAYYQEHYWKALYSQINDQLLADKLFDMGALFGVGEAVKLLQISMTADGEITLVSDGNFGPETLADVNQYGNVLHYRSTLLNHSMNVVNNNPDEGEFLQGWVTRISS